MKINFKFLATTFILSITLFLSACNTTAGFGKDMQKGGEHIQKAAEKA